MLSPFGRRSAYCTFRCWRTNKATLYMPRTAKALWFFQEVPFGDPLVALKGPLWAYIAGYARLPTTCLPRRGTTSALPIQHFICPPGPRRGTSAHIFSCPKVLLPQRGNPRFGVSALPILDRSGANLSRKVPLVYWLLPRRGLYCPEGYWQTPAGSAEGPQRGQNATLAPLGQRNVLRYCPKGAL